MLKKEQLLQINENKHMIKMYKLPTFKFIINTKISMKYLASYSHSCIDLKISTTIFFLSSKAKGIRIYDKQLVFNLINPGYLVSKLQMRIGTFK